MTCVVFGHIYTMCYVSFVVYQRTFSLSVISFLWTIFTGWQQNTCFTFLCRVQLSSQAVFCKENIWMKRHQILLINLFRVRKYLLHFLCDVFSFPHNQCFVNLSVKRPVESSVIRFLRTTLEGLQNVFLLSLILARLCTWVSSLQLMFWFTTC